jgi:hypothetical protein
MTNVFSAKPIMPSAATSVQSDFVHIGRDLYRSGSEDAEILAEPSQAPPVFASDMEAVRAQAAALVAKAPLPLRDSHGWATRSAGASLPRSSI